MRAVRRESSTKMTSKTVSPMAGRSGIHVARAEIVACTIRRAAGRRKRAELLPVSCRRVSAPAAKIYTAGVTPFSFTLTEDL